VRGLAFNEAKTRIVPIEHGVNFLGVHTRANSAEGRRPSTGPEEIA
jgi:hypothetical protein